MAKLTREKIEQIVTEARAKGERPNLRQVDLSGVDLDEVDFWGADLTGAVLSGANLHKADLSYTFLGEAVLLEADLSQADLRKAELFQTNLHAANLSGANLNEVYGPKANLSQADLSTADLRGANLSGANFSEANLSGANLYQAKLNPSSGPVPISAMDNGEPNYIRTNLSRANLREADLREANLRHADLHRANLRGAKLNEAFLAEADLRQADLREADLRGVELGFADLRKAQLRGANLIRATMVQTNFAEADLTSCSIYGISAWDLILEKTIQKDLIISVPDQPTITVDNLEVAQFVYLLLKNEKIRDVIDTIGKKGVLILGRFTPERKAVLDAIRERLRELNYVPMVFDFERPTDRDFTETILTLAGISRFIIADITNPKSSPLELQATVPNYMIPFVPIIQVGEKPFAMFKDLYGKFGGESGWVLEPLEYDTASDLVKVLEKAVITPALERHHKLMIRKAKRLSTRSTKDYSSN